MPFATPVRALLLALVAVAASPAAAQQAAGARTVTVTGSAEMAAAPDRATVSLGVVTEATTADQALEANNAAVRALIDRLRREEIESRNLQTSGFSVQPQYVFPPRQDDGTQEPPRITGYTVSNSVTAKLEAIERLGTVLDAAVQTGANQIHGISFDVTNADRLADGARDEAFADAKRKAELYAKAAGSALGSVLSVRETTERGGGPQPNAMRMEAAQAEIVPVETGEQTLRVQVEVTWQLAE